MSEIVQYQDDFMSHPKMWAIPEEKKFLMFVDNNFSYDRQWFEWYLFLWNCKNEMKKQKFCSREAKMRAILTSCPHRRERHLQSAKPWQGGVRGLSLEIVDLAIFGHNFEISAYKTEHIAHLLKRAHGQLDRDNPHPHLPPWDEKKIMEQKSWQRALRALHEDYHQSWQNFKIAPIYLPTLRNTNLIVQSCDAITFSIKGQRPILL